ncbi:putative vomeronasal receptor-like protein 4 [Callospermophilus lateralis]|uniref:putative vomeronasal receptor-like protein 4 n=1 Tax=Callospermophilus lateralis TaxID=76772 RepID=UPI0040387ED8
MRSSLRLPHQRRRSCRWLRPAPVPLPPAPAGSRAVVAAPPAPAPPLAGIGISANTFLLCLHTAAVFVGIKPRLTDLPVNHLALTHILMLLTMGLLVSADIWETQDIPGDFKCKVLAFLNRVMRGRSICTTCVLSVLQAITISPSGSWLAHFKLKSTNPIVGLFVFLWVLTMSLSSNLLLCTVATPNKTQPGLLFLTEHCSFLLMSYRSRTFFLAFMAFRDLLFLGLMVLSSTYMILFLHRYKQRSKYLHSPHFSPRSSPEQRATNTILLLISCFEILYCADCIISFFTGAVCTSDPILLGLQMLLANGYGTISPLVLISGDTQIIKSLKTKWRNKGQFLPKLI